MLETIFHPSDFTETSHLAFCHALKLAVAAGAELKIVHVTEKGHKTHFHDFPSVRGLLEAWELLPQGSRHHDVAKLGIDVEKAILHDDDPLAAISEFLKDSPSSLVVMAAHRAGKPRWFGHDSKAEPIAREAAATTLFIPDGVTGFVDPRTGQVNLKNVLVPIALQPRATTAVRSLQQLLVMLDSAEANIHLLHVGSQASLPAVAKDLSDQFRFQVHVQEGDVVTTILDASRQLETDLVVMATAGHHGFMDAIRGSTTEQVMRQLSRPLWAVTSD